VKTDNYSSPKGEDVGEKYISIGGKIAAELSYR
jgi:hypothetical protein